MKYENKLLISTTSPIITKILPIKKKQAIRLDNSAKNLIDGGNPLLNKQERRIKTSRKKAENPIPRTTKIDREDMWSYNLPKIKNSIDEDSPWENENKSKAFSLYLTQLIIDEKSSLIWEIEEKAIKDLKSHCKKQIIDDARNPEAPKQKSSVLLKEIVGNILTKRIKP
jgi:hypothetical protein